MTAARTHGVLTLGAATVIVALTGAAFWLSYAHLHDVAGAHGLSGARAWAWPATLDLFIISGELLMLRAALAGRVDPWAITLTVVGSGGSIALNIAGVGAGAQTLDYVVAAIPPSAALLAFGALMRQVHEHLAAHGTHPSADAQPVQPDAGEAEVQPDAAEVHPDAAEDGSPLPEVPPMPPVDAWTPVDWPVRNAVQPHAGTVAAAGHRRSEVTARYAPPASHDPVQPVQPTEAAVVEVQPDAHSGADAVQPDAADASVDDEPDLDPDPFLDRARDLDEVALRDTGRPASLRQLQARLRVGQRRAQRIRAQLDGGNP